MRISEYLIAFLAAVFCVNATSAEEVGFGRPATSDEIAAIDISIPPDGEGLPAGSGNAIAGEALYLQKCAACHAEGGKGKPADKLVGGIGTLGSASPVKSVGSYWPYATTLFDYIRRAMPLNAPMSLSNDETYSLTAYVLSINGIIPNDQIIDENSLPEVRMPNRNGFVDRSGVR
jgi:mono/diheme cytochrome c family protein